MEFDHLDFRLGIFFYVMESRFRFSNSCSTPGTVIELFCINGYGCSLPYLARLL